VSRRKTVIAAWTMRRYELTPGGVRCPDSFSGRPVSVFYAAAAGRPMRRSQRQCEDTAPRSLS